MNSRTPVDFAELVTEVKQPAWGRECLAIWGGECSESNLVAFLGQWDLKELRYRIWEYFGEIRFEQGTLPESILLLQRGRLFGEGGDLEVLRRGATFQWRFVGPAGVQPPAGDYGARDYWATHDDVTFHHREEAALLWGEWRTERGCWVEDRVGAALLSYPVPDGWKRVQIHYKSFSRAGRVEFVWYTGLSEWKEADNGSGYVRG